MPTVKKLGLAEYLKKQDALKKKEHARAEKIAKQKRQTVEFNAKTKLAKAEARYKKTKKTGFLGMKKTHRKAGKGGWV